MPAEWDDLPLVTPDCSGSLPRKEPAVLVLTRRKNQSIVIGDDIIVTVLDVKGDQIRLGITAPRDVQVNREELLVAAPDEP